MTILTENDSSFFFMAEAQVIDTDRDMASEWASKYIVDNPALKWIVGKYVEADNANSNGQYWTLQDLQLKQPTIQHSPMNVAHRANDIVGTFVGSEMIYAAQEEVNPYIETVGTIWKYYFPDVVSQVEEAFKQGELYLSMECVSDTITCVGPMGCGQTFDYSGPMSAAYCDHIKDRASYRQLNNPHFLAGALIAPPDRPGWKSASVNEMSILDKHPMKAEKIYSQIYGAHLSERQKNQLTASLLNATMVDLAGVRTNQWQTLMDQVVDFATNKR